LGREKGGVNFRRRIGIRMVRIKRIRKERRKGEGKRGPGFKRRNVLLFCCCQKGEAGGKNRRKCYCRNRAAERWGRRKEERISYSFLLVRMPGKKKVREKERGDWLFITQKRRGGGGRGKRVKCVGLYSFPRCSPHGGNIGKNSEGE